MRLYKIMIVDDEAEVREGIARKINWEAVGFEVVALVENGQDALEKAESLELDVVLTDIKMPFMDGLTLSTHLQRLHPSVKVIILTGFDKFEYAKEAVKLNVIEYVLKPINAEELTKLLLRIKNDLDEELARRRDTDLLMESYKKSLPLLRDHFLTELLSGTVPQSEIDYLLDQYNIPINDSKYKVAAVFELEPNLSQSPVVDRELLPISIKELVDDRLQKCCSFASLISFSTVIAVTSWDRDPIGNIMNVANQICSDCERIFKINVAAGIGKSYQDVSHIHESYLQSKMAVEYKLIMGSGKSIYIKDMEHTGHDPLVFDSLCEQQLISAIKFGSKEQISGLIDRILTDLSGVDITEWKYQAYIMAILCTVSQIASRYGLNEDEVLGEEEERFSVLSRDYTLGSLKQWLLNTCVRMSGSISNKRISASKSLAEAAKRFINENFHRQDLSVDIVCDYLHISQSYFSTIFRQETGQSYIQYLTDVRMDKAIRLLNETDNKTYMIAQKVGYDEPNYFSYVFKKKFGASPSQYRG